MKVKFYETSKLKNNQTIQKNNISDYLEKIKFVEFENIKPTKIFSTTCEIQIEGKPTFDFVAINDYPFHNKKTVFFIVEKMDFLNKTGNNKIYNYKLKLSPFATFTFDELFNGSLINVSNLHIDERDQFENLKDLKLKPDNLFQKDFTNIDNFFIRNNKYKNVILTQDEKNNKTAPEYKTKWIIAVLKTDGKINWEGNRFTSIFPEKKFEYENRFNKEFSESYPTKNIFVFFPLSDTVTRFWLEDIKDFVTIDSQYWLHLLNDSPDLINWIVLDHCPSDLITYDRKEKVYYFKNRSNLSIIKTKDIEKRKGNWIVIFEYINKKMIMTEHLLENFKLFEWEIETKIFNGINDYAKIENCIYLNFSPYKFFNIGIYGESPNSGWNFSLNNFKYLNPKVLFKRTFNPSTDTFELWDDISDNIYYGKKLSKIKRSLMFEQYSDAWKEQNKNKRLNGASDFLMPAIMSAAAFMIPGGLAVKKAASLTAFALGSTATALKHQQTRNLPDNQVQAATEITGELLYWFGTRELVVNDGVREQKEVISAAYHYTGIPISDKPFVFDNKFEDKIFKTKMRFNFIKISEFNTLKIFDNSIINQYDLKLLTLEILKQGIHFWNYDKNWNDIIKSYTFDYKIKNPNLKERENE